MEPISELAPDGLPQGDAFQQVQEQAGIMLRFRSSRRWRGLD
jgi:hypothetical protein